MRIFNIFLKKKISENQFRCTKGKKILDEKIPLLETNISWRKNYHLSKYDCGVMQGYTTVPNRPSKDEQGIFEQFVWERYGDIILLIGIRNTKEDVIHVPDTINGYSVKGISNYAFMNQNLSDVYIPNSIEYIGALAIGFRACPIYSDDDEKKIKSQNPFAHNWPTSTLIDFTYYLHQSPKTNIHGTKNSVAEEYADKHKLPFASM